MDDIFLKDEVKKVNAKNLDKAENEAKQRRINFDLTFSTREGFDVLKDLMGFCHFLQVSHVPGNTDETAFREGERNVFLYIMSQLNDEMRSKIIIGG